MKYSVITTAILILLFIVVQFVGLVINQHYQDAELPYGLTPPDVEQSQSPWLVMGGVLMVSAIILLLHKFKFSAFMKIWFYFAFLMCISVSLSAFIASWMAVIVAAFIVLLKFKEADPYLHNITEVLVYGGLVAIFAPMFNLWAAIILLVLFSIYDVIAVFVTKHMVTLAQFQEKLGILAGLVVQYKNEAAILGGGDIAFTLLFATVVMKTYGFFNAMFVVYGAAFAILILLIIGEKKKYYPAMPFVTAGALTGLIITLI